MEKHCTVLHVSCFLSHALSVHIYYMHNVNRSHPLCTHLYLAASLKPFISAIENISGPHWTSEQACSPVWNPCIQLAEVS